MESILIRVGGGKNRESGTKPKGGLDGYLNSGQGGETFRSGANCKEERGNREPP